jgi:hypothetical protein
MKQRIHDGKRKCVISITITAELEAKVRVFGGANFTRTLGALFEMLDEAGIFDRAIDMSTLAPGLTEVKACLPALKERMHAEAAGEAEDVNAVGRGSDETHREYLARLERQAYLRSRAISKGYAAARAETNSILATDEQSVERAQRIRRNTASAEEAKRQGFADVRVTEFEIDVDHYHALNVKEFDDSRGRRLLHHDQLGYGDARAQRVRDAVYERAEKIWGWQKGERPAGILTRAEREARTRMTREAAPEAIAQAARDLAVEEIFGAPVDGRLKKSALVEGDERGAADAENADASPQATPDVARAESVVACRSCGENVDAEASTCPACGYASPAGPALAPLAAGEDSQVDIPEISGIAEPTF